MAIRKASVFNYLYIEIFASFLQVLLANVQTLARATPCLVAESRLVNLNDML